MGQLNFRCKEDYLNLIDKIVREANEVNGTYELIGQVCKVLGTTEEINEIFGISYDFEREFISAIAKFDDKQIGPYDTKKYFMLIPSIKESIIKLKDDCLETRRCVINFPNEHCFQTIQFMVRENTIHVVCYMRSCNVIKNLPHDIWICSKMADIFSKTLSNVTDEHPYKYHSITMMFGSLHIFKEDLNNVL